MIENKQKNRLIHNILPNANDNTLILITGARQTGKTTSAKYFYPELNYFDLDSIE